ncbi:MAG: outer membrane protein OmpA-like peptidoglycan-associated protein [Flavobacteriales bacterium]|jgi:outer membrane protein OmpA-like peptidoglycan-associated protein
MNLFFGEKAILTLLLFVCFTAVIAQSDCERKVENKKLKKLYDKALNSKVDDRDRIEAAKESVLMGEACMPCRMQLAKLLFLRAKYGNISYNAAVTQYKEIVDQCPDYHSDPYYYLGLIAYGQERLTDAIYYFNQYVAFDSEEREAFAKDYDKKIADIEDIIPELSFFESFRSDSVEFNPTRVLGVSSVSDEYLPAISADHQQLFYTRKSDKKAKGDLFSEMVEELTISFWDDSLQRFSEGEALPTPFNMGDSYGGLSVTADGREIFVTVCKEDMEGYNNCDIYSSHYYRYLDDEENVYMYKWSELKPLGNQINQKNSWEAQPSVSSDGSELYFATFRSQDQMMELYCSYKQSDGEWGTAKPVIALNTTENEKAPFIHPDGKTLFYASDNLLGAGGYDLYMVRKKGDGQWTKPRNLGLPINTREDEHGLIVSTDGSYAFFASSRIKGSKGLDIYKFELPIPVRPKKMTVIKGKIKGLWFKDFEGSKITLKNLTTQSYVEAQMDTSDGAFTAVVAAEDAEDLILTIQKEGFAFESKLIDRKAILSGKSIETNLTLNKLIPGKTYQINDIKYQTNSAEIEPSSKLVLQEFALYLKENNSLSIHIFGHTDNVGSQKDNLQLSDIRANAVRTYLIELGLKGNRIKAKGFGATKPLNENNTELERANNRRTEFQIVKN